MQHNYPVSFLKLLLLFLVMSWQTTAQTLDPDFRPVLKKPAYLHVLIRQPDNKIIAGGEAQFIEGIFRSAKLFRLHPDGTLDASFNAGREITTVSALAIQPDSKILVGGIFHSTGNQKTSGVIRINSDGSTDTAFPQITVPGDISVISVQVDGKILLGGPFQEINGVPMNALARVNSDGTLDESFAGPENMFSDIQTIELQPDGKILLGGTFIQSTSGTQRVCLRLNTNGSPDEEFNANFPDHTGTAYSIKTAEDGQILIGGIIHYAGGRQLEYGVFRTHADGTLDHEFTANTLNHDRRLGGSTATILLQNDGKILLNGLYGEHAYDGSTDVIRTGLIRLNSNGTVDPDFERGSESNDYSFLSNKALLLDDQQVIMSSLTGTYNGKHGRSVYRIRPDGRVDNEYRPDLKNTGFIRSIATYPNGNSVITGDFTSVNEAPSGKIVQLFPNGLRDFSFQFSDSLKHSNFLTIQADNKLFTLVSPTIQKVNTDGSKDQEFHTDFFTGGNYSHLNPQDDGKILVSGSLFRPEIQLRGLFRIHGDGRLDNTFTPEINPDFNANLTVTQPDGKILVTQWTHPFSTSPERLIRLNPDGTMDNTFSHTSLGEGHGIIKSLQVQKDGKIIVSGYYYRKTDNVQVEEFVRLNPDGTPDPSFTIGSLAGKYIHSVVVLPNGQLLVGGRFDTFNGADTRNLVLLNPDGSVDATFTIGNAFNHYIQRIFLQPDGNVIITGYFLEIDNQVRYGIARILLPCMFPPAKPTVSTNGTATSATFRLVSSSSEGNQWLRDGVEIPGATAQNYDVTQRGSYSVRVTINGCVNLADSDPVVLTANEPAVVRSLKIFPNPATDQVQITFNGSLKAGSVAIYNVLGVKLLEKALSPAGDGWQTQLSTAHLPGGTYIIRLTGGTHSITRTIIKR